MGVLGGLGHRALLALHVPIVEHLLAAHMLLLDGPESLFFLSLSLEELLLS